MDESGQEPHISDIAKAMDVKEEDVAFGVGCNSGSNIAF